LLTIEIKHTNYEELLNHYAEVFNGEVKNGILQIPPHIGHGFMKLIEFPNGLQGIVGDYTINNDLLLKRTKIIEDFYTLRFDEVIVPEALPGTAQTVSATNLVKSAVFLGSTKYDWIFLTTKGTRVKSLNILFSKQWLTQFLEIESVGDLIKKYLSLRMSGFYHEPLDMEYKRILNEVVATDNGPAFDTLVIQNRVMLLLERFFTRIYYKISDSHFNVKMSNEDIDRLKAIEKELVKDFSTEPPGISKLARQATMSPSKLKNSFKEIFGLPVYQYFQKHRMNKAKAMLLSRKYTVREVGMEVGYSNLSNFAKAFKKSFDQLPSDLLDR
jgi:AraC-like DNA-binding protein